MESSLPGDPLSATAAGAAGPAPAVRAAARCGLYVHVPFCAARCSYCDFSSGRLSAAAVTRWLDALESEMGRRAPAAAHTVFHSVFFGGGTPSALSSRHFARVARSLLSQYQIAADAEITLEANPESVRPALLDAWRSAGVNRLSLGAQSFVPEELAGLGRIHDSERTAEAVAQARAAGFRRISLDLMFGFPGHTPARWSETLDRALALEAGHLSAYCFIPEAGTPLGSAALAGHAVLPEPERQAEFYATLTARAGRAGLQCYETSNFCVPGEECRQNLVYWLRRPYLGLGPSAHGFFEGVRYANLHALEAWASDLEADGSGEAEREPEREATACEEVVMLALRLGSGLALEDYPPPLADALRRRYGRALRAAAESGRLGAAGTRYWIPDRHRFIADDIISWVAARADEFDRPFTASVASRAPCPSLHSPAV